MLKSATTQVGLTFTDRPYPRGNLIKPNTHNPTSVRHYLIQSGFGPMLPVTFGFFVRCLVLNQGTCLRTRPLQSGIVDSTKAEYILYRSE